VLLSNKHCCSASRPIHPHEIHTKTRACHPRSCKSAKPRGRPGGNVPACFPGRCAWAPVSQSTSTKAGAPRGHATTPAFTHRPAVSREAHLLVFVRCISIRTANCPCSSAKRWDPRKSSSSRLYMGPWKSQERRHAERNVAQGSIGNVCEWMPLL